MSHVVRALLIALLVAVAVAVAAGCASAPGEPVPDGAALSGAHADAYRDAAALRGRGRVREALERIEPFATDEPWHVPTHLLRQDLMVAIEGEPATRAWYAAAAAAAPADRVRQLLAARLAPDQGDERETAYARLAASDPRDAWARVALSLAALRRADRLAERATAIEDAGRSADAVAVRRDEAAAIETSLRSASEAVAAAPDLGAAHGALAEAILAGQARRPGSSADAAVAAARRATELDPGDPRHFVRLARALRRAGDDPGASAALLRALETTPDDAAVLAQLGRLRLDLRDDSGALAPLERATANRPTDAAAWHDLGVARYRTGDPGGAIDAFRRALEVAPGDTKSRQALAYACAAAGRRDEAAREMETYLARGGTDREGAEAFIAEMRKPAPAPR